MNGQSMHQHGVPCPECSFVIPTTMPMLLSGEPIVCPMCGLNLHVDREKSVDSLKLVRQLYEATQEVDALRRTGKARQTPWVT